MISGDRLKKDFFVRDVLTVAPELVGKILVIRLPEGIYGRFMVCDVEAYRGPEDKACHASKGRTERTEAMFGEGGKLYIYLIYGMYWMLNVVTGRQDDPQAVLIRGLESLTGPGKITKALGIDRSFYGEDLTTSERIWFEDTGITPQFRTGPRIGVEYAGDFWKSKPWRYYIF
jgi:DNA-3-methyladenine glycosylase